MGRLMGSHTKSKDRLNPPSSGRGEVQDPFYQYSAIRLTHVSSKPRNHLIGSADFEIHRLNQLFQPIGWRRWGWFL